MPPMPRAKKAYVLAKDRAAAVRLGARLRAARRAAGFRRQEDAARALRERNGSTSPRQPFIAKCEAGARRITTLELSWFASLYQKPYAWFLTSTAADADASDAAQASRSPQPPPQPRQELTFALPRGRRPGDRRRNTSRPAVEPDLAADGTPTAVERREWLSRLIEFYSGDVQRSDEVHRRPSYIENVRELTELRMVDLWLIGSHNALGETPLYEALRLHAWSAVFGLLDLGSDVFGAQSFSWPSRATRSRAGREAALTPWQLAVDLVRRYPGHRDSPVWDQIDPIALLEAFLQHPSANSCDFRPKAVRAALNAQLRSSTGTESDLRDRTRTLNKEVAWRQPSF